MKVYLYQKGAKQLISDSYTALTAILQSNTTLTALLGTYQGTSIPLIKGGVLAEQETDHPKLIFRSSGSDKENFLKDDKFIINCVALTEREAFLVATTLIDEFNQCQNPINGYFVQSTCRIIGGIPNPTDKGINVPVDFRIVNM